MKPDVIKGLKEKGRTEVFTELRYKKIVELMKYAISKDRMLKGFLSTSPDFKVNYIVDHIIKLSDLGKI